MNENEYWNCWTRNDRLIDGEHYLGIEGLCSGWSNGRSWIFGGVCICILLDRRNSIAGLPCSGLSILYQAGVYDGAASFQTSVLRI